MLERQRRALSRTLFALTDWAMADPEDVELVEGIQNMLDHWSDNRAK